MLNKSKEDIDIPVKRVFYQCAQPQSLMLRRSTRRVPSLASLCQFARLFVFAFAVLFINSCSVIPQSIQNVVSGGNGLTEPTREREAQIKNETPPRNGTNMAPVVQSVKQLHTQGGVNAVAWNRDGSVLAALSHYGDTITLWNTNNWSVVKEFKRISGPYSQNSFAFLPDGSLLTAAPMGDFSKDPYYANSPLADPNYPSLEMFSLVQWNPATGKPVRYLPVPPTDPSIKVTNTFAVSMDGAYAAGINKFSVLVYDTRNGSLVKKLDIPRVPAHPELLWTESYRKSEAYRKWMANNPPSSFPDNASSVAFSPNGKVLAACTLSGVVHFFSIPDGAILTSFVAFPLGHNQGQFACDAIAYSTDGKYLATGKSYLANLTVSDKINTIIWNVSDHQSIASLEGSTFTPPGGVTMPNHVHSLSWSPKGKVLAVGDMGALKVWEIGDSGNTLLYTENMPGESYYSTAFSSQGTLAVAIRNVIQIYQIH